MLNLWEWAIALAVLLPRRHYLLYFIFFFDYTLILTLSLGRRYCADV